MGRKAAAQDLTRKFQKGFRDRKDIRKMNDSALFEAKTDWYGVADFHLITIPDQIKKQYTDATKSMAQELDAYRRGAAYLAGMSRFVRRVADKATSCHISKNILIFSTGALDVLRNFAAQNEKF